MDLEEGNSHFGYCGKSIAHCKSLDFTFLPFTFLPFEGGRRTWKKETHTSVTGGKSIAYCKFVVFTFLPFTFLPCSYQ